MLIVLTREAGYNDELIRWVRDAGDVVEAPLTTTQYRDVADVARDIEASGLAGDFTTLVVTSVRARRYVGVAVAALAPGARVLSVGARTSQMLADEGVRVDEESDAGAIELASSVREGPVLFVAAREARAELEAALGERGVAVVKVVAYETVALEVDEDVAWLLARADVVVIGAPSAWSLARTYVASTAWVVVPGATTAQVVRRDHARVIESWGEELGEVLAGLDAS